MKGYVILIEERKPFFSSTPIVEREDFKVKYLKSYQFKSNERSEIVTTESLKEAYFTENHIYASKIVKLLDLFKGFFEPQFGKIDIGFYKKEQE